MKTVDKIISDLCNRGGLRQEWDAIDEDIQNAIREKGAKLIGAPAWLDPADAANGRWYFGRWDSQGWGENESFRPILRYGSEWLGDRGDEYTPPTALYGPIEPQDEWFDPSEDDDKEVNDDDKEVKS